MTPPTQIFQVPLPTRVAEALRAVFPDPRQLAAHGASPAAVEAGRVLDGLAALWFDDAPWLALDGELVSPAMDASGAPRRFRLPLAATVLAAIGETGASDYRLRPAYRLPDDRQLWFAFGYGDRTPPGEPSFFAIPVVFSPATSPTWATLRHARGGTRRLRGTSFGHGVAFTDRGRKVLLLGEIDAGADFHLDDFIMVPVGTECDLEARTFRDAPPGGAVRFEFEPRLSTTHADAFLIDRESAHTTELAWSVTEDGRVVGRRPAREPNGDARFELHGRAPRGWDQGGRLVRGSSDGARTLALDLLDPTCVTVSVWTEAPR